MKPLKNEPIKLPAQLADRIPPGVEDVLAASTDSSKTTIDIYKHLTTLSTGAIVLLGTFIDKVSPAKSLRIAIPIAVVCFLVCILYSVKTIFITQAVLAALLQFRTSFHNTEKDKQLADLKSAQKTVHRFNLPSRFAYVIVQYSFFLGIISVGAFIIANMR